MGTPLKSQKKVGRNKGGFVVRCWTNGCQHRNSVGGRLTINKHPAAYWGSHAWRGRCPACGNQYAVDWYRTSGAECKANRCDCAGYPFRHRRGSLFCQHGGRAHLAQFGFVDRDRDEFLEWREAGQPLPDSAPVELPAYVFDDGEEIPL